MNARPPPPERIAQWQAQAVELLAVRTPVEKVLAHLEYVGCPPDIARAIIARTRDRAYARLSRKSLATIASGLVTMALAALYITQAWEPGDRFAWLLRALLFFAFGLGLAMYGVLEWVFDQIDVRSGRFRGARTHRSFRPRK